jgi:hypothetical protein
VSSELALKTLELGYALNEELLSAYDPDFGVRSAFCQDYSRLLRGDCDAAVEMADVLETAKQIGRLILSDKGGSGKTVYLRRLMNFARKNGLHCVFLNLSKWNEEHTELALEINSDPIAFFSFLLSKFADEPIDLALLESLPPLSEKLIIIDGLNETPGKSAVRVLKACNEAAHTFPSLQIIVSDRLVRRHLDNESKWAFLSLIDLDDATVKRFSGDSELSNVETELLRSPFFLEQQRRGNLEGSRIETIIALISKNNNVDQGAISALSEASYSIYKSNGSRTFPTAELVKFVDEQIIKELIQAGILLERDNSHLCFAHHWMHDCLAALHVADNEKLWNVENRYDTLDALTFRRNSFDAVGFVLQRLNEQSSATFLQAVYDWNPYAAGYALSEIDEQAIQSVSPTVRVIVLAMLALSKFDRHLRTAGRAADALDLFRDEIAVSMRLATTIDQLKDIVSSIDYKDALFTDWKALFTRPDSNRAAHELLDKIGSENSILGWTASNVVKQFQLSDAEVARLTVFADDERHAVRWRAVHALGAVCTADVVDKLAEALFNDDHTDVKLGAIRSLIEIASRDGSLTQKVIEHIEPKLTELKEIKPVMGELENAVFVRRQDSYDDWESSAISLFNSLIDSAMTVDEIERWSDIASQLRIHRHDEMRVTHP